MRALRSKSLEDRFWEKVNKTGHDCCWTWKAACIKGYGSIGNGKGKTILAHRLSWELRNGPIPTGKYILHKCDNTRCVNPEHLYVGDAVQNAKDCTSRGRAVSGKSVITDSDVAEIFRLHVNGMSNTEIARMYGVQQPAICKVLNGKTPRYARLIQQHCVAAR